MADNDDTNDASDGTAGDGTGDAAGGDTGKDGQPFDAGRAQALIDKLRSENRDLKKTTTRVGELEQRLQALADAEKTDLERAQARIAELEQGQATVSERLRHAHLLAELARPEHGLVNAQAAAKLLEGVEYDTDGRPANLDEILPGFLDANAFLRGAQPKQKPPNLNSGDGLGDQKPPALTAAEIEAAKAAGMTPERFHALKNVQTPEDWKRLRDAEKAAAGR